MAGKCGFLSPVTEIESRIKEKIKFQTEVEGKVTTMLGTSCLPDLEANKRIEVDKLKIKVCCYKQPMTWRIQVLLDGNRTRLYLEPIHLLNYAQIIFDYRTLDDGRTVLCARGLKKVYCGRVAQPRKDKAPNHQTVSHAGGCYSSLSHIANDMHDSGDFPLIVPQLGYVVGSNQVAIAKGQPIGVNHKERADHKSLMYYPPSIIGGRKVAKISASDFQHEIQRWEHAIVGYLIGEDTQELNVERYVNEQWRDFGSFKTYVLKTGFFLFNFTNGADKSKVLEQGQWFINNKPFILKRWTPNLSLDPSLFLASVPIWVRFPHLNLQLWSLTSLAKISSLIGRPLFIDEPTAKKERLQYARVCVEINLGDKLPHIIPICVDNNDTILEQAVEYEWKPQPCAYCCSVSHISSACALTSDVGAEDSFISKDPTGGDNGLDDSSTTIDIKYSAEDSFPTQQSFGMHFNASSLPLEAGIDQETIEELESDEDYSSTTCLLNSEENVAKNWLPYYKKLRDMGFTVKKH